MALQPFLGWFASAGAVRDCGTDSLVGNRIAIIVADAKIFGPVVNKVGEFDGNIQSLVLDCIYTDKQARAVSVDSAAITEALRKVYEVNALADELGR